jgi:Tfp pilus assembly protein PilN
MFTNLYSLGNKLGPSGLARPLHLRRGSGSRHWNVRRPALGIEVRGSALHLAFVRPGWGRSWIAGTASISDYAQLSTAQLGEQLHQLLPRRGEEPIVVMGLPRSNTVVRLSSLPNAAKGALREALNLQAEMYRPSEEEAFYWDAALAPHGEELAAALAFATRSEIDRFSSLFSSAGYPLSRLTLNQFALLQLAVQCRPKDGAARFVLVDIADSDVELGLVDDDRLVYSRGFARASDGTGPILSETLVSEIRLAFSTLRWKQEDAVPVVLAGQIEQPLEAGLKQVGQVVRLQEWLQVQTSSSAAGEAHWGAVALALDGLRWKSAFRLNLLPAELRPVRRGWDRLPTYVLLAANALLLASLGLREPIQRQIVLRQYRSEIARLQSASKQTQQLLESQKRTVQYLQILGDYQARGHESLDALSELAQRVPADTWLNNYVYRHGQVEIIGVAKSASAVLPLVEASPRFTNVKFTGALTKDVTGSERFHMQMGVK